MPELDQPEPKSPPPSSADPESDDCVFLTCFTLDFNFLSTLLRYSGLRLRRAQTLEQADFLLTVTGATVLLCDAMFLDGSWRDCAKMLADLHPQVSLLILANEVDVPVVQEALDQGAYGVSWKPLRLQQMHALIFSARESSADRMNLRAHSETVL